MQVLKNEIGGFDAKKQPLDLLALGGKSEAADVNKSISSTPAISNQVDNMQSVAQPGGYKYAPTYPEITPLSHAPVNIDPTHSFLPKIGGIPGVSTPAANGVPKSMTQALSPEETQSAIEVSKMPATPEAPAAVPEMDAKKAEIDKSVAQFLAKNKPGLSKEEFAKTFQGITQKEYDRQGIKAPEGDTPWTIGGKTIDELHGTGPIGGVTRVMQSFLTHAPTVFANIVSFADKYSPLRLVDMAFGTDEQAQKDVQVLPNEIKKVEPYLQKKMSIDPDAVTTKIGQFATDLAPLLIPGGAAFDGLNFASKAEKIPSVVKFAEESPKLYKYIVKPTIDLLAKKLPQNAAGAEGYAIGARGDNTNPEEVATAMVLDTAISSILKTPSAIKWLGEQVYGVNVRPTADEAKALQNWVANGSKGPKPITSVKTALETGSPVDMIGRRSAIGDEAKTAANNIFKKEINPVIQKIDADGFTTKWDDLGAAAKRRNMESNQGSKIEKEKTNEAIDEFIADFKQYGDEVNLSEIQKNKSSLDSFTPKKAMEKGFTPRIEQNAKINLANELRNTLHDTIMEKAGIDSRTKFRDWANLEELAKMGIKARTEGSTFLPTGGSFVGLRGIYDTVLTPITSTVGKFLYRLGKGLTLEAPAALNGSTLREIIEKQGGKIDKNGLIVPGAKPTPKAPEPTGPLTPQQEAMQSLIDHANYVNSRGDKGFRNPNDEVLPKAADELPAGEAPGPITESPTSNYVTDYNQAHSAADMETADMMASHKYSEIKDKYAEAHGKNMVNPDLMRPYADHTVTPEVPHGTMDAATTHEPSSALTNQHFKTLLSEHQGGNGVVVAGGSGAGKGAVIKKLGLHDTADILVDKVGPTKELQKMLENGMKVDAYVVIPNPEKIAEQVVGRAANPESGGRTLSLSNTALPAHLKASKFFKETHDFIKMAGDNSENLTLHLVSNEGSKSEIHIVDATKALEKVEEFMNGVKENLNNEHIEKVVKMALDDGKITMDQYKQLLALIPAIVGLGYMGSEKQTQS